MRAPASDSVRPLVDGALAKHAVPGAAIAAVAGGELDWVEGFGVRSADTGDPVRRDTIFAVASLSKPPFAYTVLRLADRGLLALDTPLSELDPRPYDAYGLDPRTPELGAATARHVLSHSSGLGNWGAGDRGRFTFAPGSAWQYSGEGYQYLQTVVEHLTGTTLDELARAEVVEPLSLRSTGYVWNADDADRFASGHGTSSTGGHEFGRPFAAFSLHTTAGDFGRFVAETLTSTIGRAMRTPQVVIDDALAWGLGWGLAGAWFWHWGDVGDFQSAVVGSTDGRALVCLTNGDGGLAASAEIVEAALGPDAAFPIRAVLDRGW